MRVCIRSLAAGLVVLVISVPASAQVLGSVAGTVRDSSGAVLPGASVEASSVQNNTFGAAWQRPVTVIQPRFVKVAARWDF